MYRTVAFICADDGIDLNDEDAVVRRADALDIAFDTTGPRARVLADGRDVTDDIRTPATDRIVSAVSAYPGVRSALLPCQRAFANGRDVVAEGRDIGTVVFPDADLKVFLTADPARARTPPRAAAPPRGCARCDDHGARAHPDARRPRAPR